MNNLKSNSILVSGDVVEKAIAIGLRKMGLNISHDSKLYIYRQYDQKTKRETIGVRITLGKP